MTRWLSAMLVRHPLLVDAALALLVAVITVSSDVFGHQHRAGSALVWDVLLALPLVVRRRTPVVAAVAIGLVCLAQWISGDLADGDLVVLVMLYTLGVWERRWWVLGVAVAVAEVGVVMAVLRWDPDQRPWLSVVALSGTVTAAWVIGAYVRMRRAYVASMVERAENAERDRDAQARIAVADERARMARELHDIIAHSLSVMITLDDAVVALAPGGDLRDTAAQASSVGRQALAEMQRLLGVLRGGADAERTPQPGTSQLTDLVTIVRSAGPAVELRIAGESKGLGPSRELAVYRIVQESLTNVLKHAGNVTRVVIDVCYQPDRVSISVRNNGETTAAAGEPGGHGLTGMRERTALFGGRADAGPEPGGGWIVTAEIPNQDSTVST